MPQILNSDDAGDASFIAHWVKKSTFLELRAPEENDGQARQRCSSAPPRPYGPAVKKDTEHSDERLNRLNTLWKFLSSPGQLSESTGQVVPWESRVVPKEDATEFTLEASSAQLAQVPPGEASGFPANSSYLRKRFRPCKGKRLRMQKYIQRQANEMVGRGSPGDGIWSDDFEVPESVLRNPVTRQLFQKMVNGKVKEMHQVAVKGGETKQPQQVYWSEASTEPQQAFWSEASTESTLSTWSSTSSAPMTPPTYEYVSPMPLQMSSTHWEQNQTHLTWVSGV